MFNSVKSPTEVFVYNSDRKVEDKINENFFNDVINWAVERAMSEEI